MDDFSGVTTDPELNLKFMFTTAHVTLYLDLPADRASKVLVTALSGDGTNQRGKKGACMRPSVHLFPTPARFTLHCNIFRGISSRVQIYFWHGPPYSEPGRPKGAGH